jgi:hypothetical protein
MFRKHFGGGGGSQVAPESHAYLGPPLHKQQRLPPPRALSGRLLKSD